MRQKLTISAVTATWLAIFVALATHASAQQVTCSSFTTQQQAQAYYDQHRDQTQLDSDGDGKACEGLPGGATTAPAVAPAATTAPTSPKNGAATGVMARA